MKESQRKVSAKEPQVLAKNLPAASVTPKPSLRDPLQKYLAEVQAYPVLTPEEEFEVAKRYQEHQDKEAAQKLVLSNLRLVAKIAQEYKNAYYNLLDLIQEGNVGLMRAVEKYDPDRGVRFSSYAVWWVRAYILKYILDNFRLVKIGTTQAQKKLFFNLMQEKNKIEKLGFVPTTKMLSERLDVKEKEIEEMEIRLGQKDFELDAPKANFEGTLHMDFLESGQESASSQAEQKELQDILAKHLSEFTQTLTKKEASIFSQRLFSEVPLTLQEIASQYGISRERIRQIENRLVKKMQSFFSDRGLKIEKSAETLSSQE